MEVVKVAITGPESSGKSDLTKYLAEKFQTSFAPEYAREYLEWRDGDYEYKDLIEICEGQIANEERAIENANKIVFFDTDMLVLKIWSRYRFDSVPRNVALAFEQRQYDAVLLCKPDLPWIPDPLRESPDEEERLFLFELFKRQVEAYYPNKFCKIEGQGIQRFKVAQDYLYNQFDI
ncbi:MAG TPA: ATP-binding protein [Cryomorphaceae bacterium]|nr:ATP-binding protein [Cryomorphaceae bacterium]